MYQVSFFFCAFFVCVKNTLMIYTVGLKISCIKYYTRLKEITGYNSKAPINLTNLSLSPPL